MADAAICPVLAMEDGVAVPAFFAAGPRRIEPQAAMVPRCLSEFVLERSALGKPTQTVWQ
jgi:hypothetical protein